MILILAVAFLLACYLWGDWKNWQSYYPTFLFLIAGDLIYLYVTSAKPLWQYTAKIFAGSITTLIVALIIYPCTVLLFIPIYHHQSGLWRRIGYIAFWVCIYYGLELLALKYNYIQHFNGWNIWYSLLFDSIVFPLLIIHQKMAPAAWLLAGLIGVLITVWFRLPAPY